MLRNQPIRLVMMLLAAVLAAFSLPAIAGDITVTRVAGSVKVLVGKTSISVTTGSKLTPPAKIETGADGFLRIEQASSTLDIGPNSMLLIPDARAESENIIQTLGRVLYSVKPRKTRSFSVQTPYLVSVVKGTVFSVAIENEATSVSLMEGSVELVADGIAPVLLLPNDTATRGVHDRSINVTKVDVAPPAALPQAAVLGSTTNAAESIASTPVVANEAALLSDLNEITAAHREQRPTATVPENPAPTPPPVTPESPQPGVPPVTTPTPGLPTPEAPAPEVPTQPAPAPEPEVPGTQPETPAPGDDNDDHDHDNHDDDDDASACARRKCDSDDDHDHGGGNDRK